MGLLFPRVLTDDELGEHIEYKTVDARIERGDGTVAFEQKGLLFPKFYSQRAVNIIASKYFYGSGEERERGLLEIVSRVVNAISAAGTKEGYFKDNESRRNFINELQHILVHQYATFNSPVWFNLGVAGIPQQISACYILGLEDNMESILEVAQTEGMIFKRGSGSGLDVSPLRAAGAPLSGGGTASGPLSFMKLWDAGAGVIKSGGVTRRAACMRLIDMRHPDAEAFIKCKGTEEIKAKTLIAAGYDPSIDGEAYGSVFFQNANHSIMIDDVVMKSLDTSLLSGEYHLLFDAIAEEAWKSGDPGVMFSDTINKWNTCPKSGRIVATNPCGEYIWLNNTSCNLGSINLIKFMDKGIFDMDRFTHVTKIMITAMDILCGLGDYPTEKIAEETLKYRTLGLGFTNLGAMLMSAGYPYDSEAGRGLASEIASTMSATAYLQSAKMAEVLGAFSEYDAESMMCVIRTHGMIASGDGAVTSSVWQIAEEAGHAHGFRNAQVTVIAPTGTISFMMDCDSTGIEPVLAPEYTKSLVGGGDLVTVPQCVEDGLDNCTAMLKIGAQVTKVIEEDPIFATALGENRVSPQGHLEMLKAVQPFISGGISKTINLPEETTVEEIKEIYLDAWTHDLKNVAVYRDGSKGSQPLNVTKKHKTVGRVQLPDDRQAVTHKFRIAAHSGYITVGLYDNGMPGEVFINMAKQGSTISGLMDSFAKMLSFCLQHGISLDFLVEKMKGSAFEPSGHTGNPDVPFAKSTVDYVMRWLEKRFLEQPTLPWDNTSAPTCPECGILMKTTGNCHVCPECGASGGCG